MRRTRKQSRTRRNPSRRLKPRHPDIKSTETGTVAADDKKAEASAEAKSDAVNVEAPTAAITTVEEAKIP